MSVVILHTNLEEVLGAELLNTISRDDRGPLLVVTATRTQRDTSSTINSEVIRNLNERFYILQLQRNIQHSCNYEQHAAPRPGLRGAEQMFTVFYCLNCCLMGEVHSVSVVFTTSERRCLPNREQ